ncbi:MAG: hypothetical protein HYY31_01390 [Chloroflexi bacterium]|nr:hypothetical protein [Chloroflexota bacterium]
MRFRVIHEAIFEITVEAASVKDAEKAVAAIPYAQWEKTQTVREEYVPIEESPINPRAGD